MSFDDYEGSRASGAPTQLFLFRYGIEDGEFYAYTDHTQELTVDHGGTLGEIVYSPVPCERDGVTSNGTLDKSALKISLDVGSDIAELFRIYPPSNVVTLTIFHGHLDDPDVEFVVVWAGRVVAASREHSELQLSGEPVSTQLRRPGLRRNYQYGCMHALYEGLPGQVGCHASKAAATVSGTVSSIDNNTVTLAPGWEGAFPQAKFLRGMLEWTPAGASTERRAIIRVAGNVLTLSGIAKDLDVGDAVDVVLGCNHKAYASEGGDCQPLHNNINDFGGCRWIPIKNVINKNPYY